MGGSNAKKWDDHQMRKFFINNFVEDLRPFKAEQQGLLIVFFRFQCGEKVGLSPKKEFSLKQKNDV